MAEIISVIITIERALKCGVASFFPPFYRISRRTISEQPYLCAPLESSGHTSFVGNLATFINALIDTLSLPLGNTVHTRIKDLI